MISLFVRVCVYIWMDFHETVEDSSPSAEQLVVNIWIEAVKVLRLG